MYMSWAQVPLERKPTLVVNLVVRKSATRQLGQVFRFNPCRPSQPSVWVVRMSMGDCNVVAAQLPGQFDWSLYFQLGLSPAFKYDQDDALADASGAPTRSRSEAIFIIARHRIGAQVGSVVLGTP